VVGHGWSPRSSWQRAPRAYGTNARMIVFGLPAPKKPVASRTYCWS
jgi:hypothetical protein